MRAVFDLWLVGDTFLRDIWPTLIMTNSKAKADNTAKPYIFDNFNVSPYYARGSSLTKSIVARLHNEVINQLNDKMSAILKYIILMADKDLVEATRVAGFGCKVVFESILFWLADNLNRSMQIHLEDVQHHKSGAIINQPQFIWIKMLTRPFITQTDKGCVFAQGKTFNKILDAVISKFENKSVIDFDIPDDRDLFDLRGNLSANGKTQFCRELNRQV